MGVSRCTSHYSWNGRRPLARSCGCASLSLLRSLGAMAATACEDLLLGRPGLELAFCLRAI
eukprot:scaffold5980_cov145-Isochrysis_galbana.AAC.10